MGDTLWKLWSIGRKQTAWSFLSSNPPFTCTVGSPHIRAGGQDGQTGCDAWKTLWGELCSGEDFVLRLLSGWGQRRGLIPALLLLALSHFWRSHHRGTPPATAQTPFPALISQTQPSGNNPYFSNPFQVTPIHLKMRMFLLRSPPL